MTKEEKEQNIETLNKLIGFGNDDAKLIFFGIEEGGEWGNNNQNQKQNQVQDKDILDAYKKLNKEIISNEELKDKLGEKLVNENNDASHSPVYRIIAECLGDEKDINFIKKIGSEKKDLIVANLFPLAVSSSNNDYPKTYNKLFGIENRNDYCFKYWCERKERLKRFFQKRKNTTIICMGKSYWDIFKKVIEPCDEPKEKSYFNDENKKYQQYKSNGNTVYLVYHPGHGWLKKEHLEELKICKK